MFKQSLTFITVFLLAVLSSCAGSNNNFKKNFSSTLFIEYSKEMIKKDVISSEIIIIWYPSLWNISILILGKDSNKELNK